MIRPAGKRPAARVVIPSVYARPPIRPLENKSSNLRRRDSRLLTPTFLISPARAREVALNCADIRFVRRLRGAISFGAVNVTQRCETRV